MEKSLFCRWCQVIPEVEHKDNCKGMEFPFLAPRKLVCAGNSGWGHWGGGWVVWCQHKQQAMDCGFTVCGEGMEDGTLHHSGHLRGDGVGLKLWAEEFSEAPQSPRN